MKFKTMNLIKNYKTSLCMIFMYILFLLYPLSVTIFNPPPEEKYLRAENIKIIYSNENHPNITAILDDGEIKKFDFPTSNYSLAAGLGKSSVSSRYFSLLSRGCKGYIETDEMRFLFFGKSTRIWSIECGDTNIPYAAMTAMYKRTELEGYFIGAIIHIFVLGFCGLFIYSDWRKSRVSRSMA